MTLEGIALLGNPDYKLVMEAYPFVARKLLSDDRPGGAESVAGSFVRVDVRWRVNLER